MSLPVVISNHDVLRAIAERFDIDYYHLPITEEKRPSRSAASSTSCSATTSTLSSWARYMQILTDNFIERYENRIINIHHSFLPAFPGARPYHAAHERGVKMIGATSHYTTETLDAGPIIEQDIVQVSHEDDIGDRTAVFE